MERKVPQIKNQVLKDDCWIMGPPSRSQMRSHDRHIRVLRVFVYLHNKSCLTSFGYGDFPGGQQKPGPDSHQHGIWVGT